MSSLKVYQLGVSGFGRYGFEKLIEIQNHLEEVDVEFRGVYERDFEALEKVEKFADAHEIEVETFSDIDELYRDAEKQEGKVMIYDAGPVETRPEHIYRSMRNNFFHLAERPPSLSRDQHIQERKLTEKNDVFWKVDFLERENPVVKKTVDILEEEEIESIKIFRESSTGVQKTLQPVELSGTKGGDIIDKLTSGVYLLDFLEAAGYEIELEVENADAKYMMPKNPGADRMMTVEGAKADEIDDTVATAQTAAKLDAAGIEVELHSSWLGVSDEARKVARILEDSTGHRFIRENYTEADGTAFRDEEARFFVIEGSRRLAGDLISGRLFDLENGEDIEAPYLLHDPLYRVIEKAVLQASGREKLELPAGEIDEFMNAVFDIRDIALENTGEFFDELEHANTKIGNMIVEDLEMDEEEVNA